VFLFTFSTVPSFDFCAERDEIDVEKENGKKMQSLIYAARLRYSVEGNKTRLIYARVTRHASKLIYARVTKLN
jgi:hypothetical protein